MLQHLLLGLERPEYITRRRKKIQVTIESCTFSKLPASFAFTSFLLAKNANSQRRECFIRQINIFEKRDVICFEKLHGSIKKSICFSPLSYVLRQRFLNRYKYYILCYHKVTSLLLLLIMSVPKISISSEVVYCCSLINFLRNSYFILQIYHAKSFKMRHITYLYLHLSLRYS